MQERDEIRSVLEMKKTLGLNNYRLEEMRDRLKEYRQLLAHHFDSDRRRQKMFLSDFLATPAGQEFEANGSSFLILFGCNEVGPGTVRASWLSPLAVDWIQSRLDSNRIVAYGVCTESGTLEQVLSRLILQILDKNPTVLRRERISKRYSHNSRMRDLTE
jgi:hypothetical protein